MRAFFIVILFFLTLILVASGLFGNTNLTSNTPGSGVAPAAAAAAPAAVAPAARAPVAQQPQVITIQESPTSANQTNASIPVTGGCTNPYTVQPGDMLSQIAVNCNTTLAVIRQANPQITDANVIFPGQKLVIPNASQAVQPTAAPVQNAPAAQVPVPVTGLLPMIQTGTGLQVKAIGYPANTPVNIAIGPQNKGDNVLTSGITDADGNLVTRIVVPSAPDSTTPWVVVVATTSQPPVQAMSQPFTIALSQ